MAPKELASDWSCTQTARFVWTPSLPPCGRVLLALVFAVLISARSEASPILVSFNDVLPTENSPFSGLALSGSFTYNDPYGLNGCAPACTFAPISTFPVLSLSLNVGSFSFNLSHVLPGAHVQGPLGDVHWGPVAQINPTFLPSGLTSMRLLPGATVFFEYTTAAGAFLHEPALITTRSVPGLGSFAVCLSALLALPLWRRSTRASSR
jgi:hypothetical protein